MHPHPDFAQLSLPRDFPLGDVRLTPLSPDQVDEDLDAVQATAHLMEGIFGDWPDGLTRAANLIDLAWHDREFTARRSFAWIVRDADDTYIGCFYLYPEIGARGQVTAILWLCDIADRTATARKIKAALTDWLATHMPPDLALDWVTRPRLE